MQPVPRTLKGTYKGRGGKKRQFRDILRVLNCISFSCSSLEEGHSDELEFSSLVLPSKRAARTSGTLLFKIFSRAHSDHMLTKPKTEGLWANKVTDIQQRKRKFQLRPLLNIYEALSLFFYFVDLVVFLFHIFVMLELV